MVKSPWQREENGSQSPCQIEHAMGMKESHPGSPSEDYFDITEQHAQLDEGHIKTEPHDEQCMDFERDPFDELAELLEEENVPVYLVDMPLEAPPPPSISLSDDCFLFTRRSKVEIASPVASSPASISETLALDSPKKSETALEPIDEAHVQSKSRLHSRQSCGSPPWHPSRRRRSRSGSTKKRQCSPIRSAPRLRNEHKGDRTTCSRDGAHRKSSSMETKRCNKSRAKSPGQIRRERVPRKSTTRISADTNRNRTRSPNRTSSNDREQFRKQMSYNRLSRRKFEEHWNAFGRRRSRSGSSNRRPLRRDSLSPIRSPHRGRREFPRYIRRYSPKRLSRQRCLSREPTKSHSRSRSRQRCRSRQQPKRHSRSRSRQHCPPREPPKRHSSSRSRQQCSREPIPIRHMKSYSHAAVNETRIRDTVSPVCSDGPVEKLQPSDFSPVGPAAPMTHNSPSPILPIITSRFESPGPPPPRHLPQMPLAVASNQMWYTQTHYTHFEYRTATMQDGTNWQAPAPVYNYLGALGPQDLRHRLGSTRSLPLGPHDLRHRILGRPEYNSLPTEQEHMAPPYNPATLGQTGYPCQYYPPNGYY